MNLLRDFHICHTRLTRNSMPGTLYPAFIWLASHSSIRWISVGKIGILIWGWDHTCDVHGHSKNKCSRVSGCWVEQREHIGSAQMFLRNRLSLVGSAFWCKYQRKNLSLGGIWSFQSFFQEARWWLIGWGSSILDRSILILSKKTISTFNSILTTCCAQPNDMISHILRLDRNLQNFSNGLNIKEMI